MTLLRRISITSILALLSLPLTAQDDGVVAEEFERIPPKSPMEELASFSVKEGFRLELVASEPLVEDPVAICFDGFGRLFVAELHDHQHLPDPKTSEVKMLTDEDGDGKFDAAVTLAEGLGWITAIAPWDGGVYVGVSPDLIYLKDTNGDGKADLKRTVFSGFDMTEEGSRMKNYHHERSLNNFNWGPGNRFYCAGGMNGGFVRNMAHPGEEAVQLQRMDFSFDPRLETMRAETGSSQHGMGMDDWGNRYQTKNSDPAIIPAYDLRYRLRNPGAALPAPMVSISRPGPKGPVFRLSRTEPWREARTRLRAAGIEKGPVEEGGTVSGYFTGTADSEIYRGGLFPEEYYGSLFVGEVSENIVHRKEIHFPNDRVEPDAVRPDDEADYEFIASTDNWFRPVQITNGPGGALYICDMYRELVEAWHTIPDYIREHLDRDGGKDKGRIWRLVPDNESGNGIATAKYPGEMNTGELVVALSSPNGWTRDTASRILYQRQDQSEVLALTSLAADPDSDPRAALHALYALDGLGKLKRDMVEPALQSKEPHLRIHALRLLEKLDLASGDSQEEVPLGFVNDPDPRVLYQLAFNLGSYRLWNQGQLLMQIASAYPDDEWLAAAVASSADELSLPVLLHLSLDSMERSSAAVSAVCREAGRKKVPLPEGFADLANDEPEQWIPVLISYGSGVVKNLKKSELGTLQTRCQTIVGDNEASPDLRAQCLNLLAVSGIPEAELIGVILPLLKSGVSGELQNEAMKVFQREVKSESGGIEIVGLLPDADTRLRPELVHLLTRRPSWCRQLLGSVKSGQVQSGEISPADAVFLRGHSDPAIANLAEELLPEPPDRNKVVKEFQLALALQGDSPKGEIVFRERCMVCHRFGEEGGQVGPAMGEFVKHGKGQILLNLLDPNKTVQPDYLGYLVTLNSGEVAMGRILEDTSAGVVVRDVAGNDRQIPREEIKSVVSTGRSLMPEGIEVGLETQEVANLLQFIISRGE